MLHFVCELTFLIDAIFWFVSFGLLPLAAVIAGIVILAYKFKKSDESTLNLLLGWIMVLLFAVFIFAAPVALGMAWGWVNGVIYSFITVALFATLFRDKLAEEERAEEI